MQKLLSGAAAGAAFALFASSALACSFHKEHVTASMPAEQTVAMSTLEDAGPPPTLVNEMKTETTVCPEDAVDCTPANK